MEVHKSKVPLGFKIRGLGVWDLGSKGSDLGIGVEGLGLTGSQPQAGGVGKLRCGCSGRSGDGHHSRALDALDDRTLWFRMSDWSMGCLIWPERQVLRMFKLR